MKIHPFFFSLLLLILPFQGCEVANQAKKSINLLKCDFRIRSVENVNMAGVSLQNINTVKDLNLTDMAKILSGFASPVFPLTLQLNLEGRNPNSSPAGLNRIEWILFIDDIQMTTGILSQPFTIPANNGIAIIPMQIGIDLKTVLSGRSAKALLNFGMNLAGYGNVPTRFKIKLKPSIVVGNYTLTYPGYISVSTNYGSTQ
ncbi:MAG: LEA type 2 family protein [Bacteroidales bacterium]|nr:LEA type 2 family protein [Bacteroidales bacterium]